MNEFPEKDIKDYAHGAVKAALNLIPDVGRSLSVIFETVFSSPLDKRKEAWFKQLAQTVEELSKEVDGFSLESLSNNEEFISFYLQASNIALRTHNKEKLKALNSSVKNCILLKDISESKKMIFLRIIDEMTPFHFQVFDFLSNYPDYLNNYNQHHSVLQKQVTRQMSRGKIYDVWDSIHKEVSSLEFLITIVISDLKNYGFLNKNFDMSTTEDNSFEIKSFSTSFGQDFIRFINE